MAAKRMRAWEVTGDFDGHQLIRLGTRPVPSPGADEVLVQVRACGICRTDLHLAEGDLPPKMAGVVPGHEAVGEVVAVGTAVSRFAMGDRIGVAWLRHTCGECRWCRNGSENLCRASTYTGWDADGGFAEYVVVPAAYAYRIPEGFSDVEAAPLLCAGIIGYRALRRANLPTGGRLGIYGFGASAHLTAQLAIAEGAEVHVLTRDVQAQRLALELGATSAQDAHATPPVTLDAAILFAPAGDLVPVALAALDQAGTLAVAGIHLSDIPGLSYPTHLFGERTLTSVTANTRADGEQFLRLAATHGVQPHVVPYPFEHTDRALADLRDGRVAGAAVVTIP